MLNVGDKVPDFTLPLAKADGSKESVSFHSLLGTGPVVLAFYPLAFTGVCTQEMCDLRDNQGDLEQLRATTLGFSIDTVFTNVQFAKQHNLPHGIYSDANRIVVDTLWETMDVAGVHKVAKRGYLIVKSDGTVAEKWVAENPGQWPGIDPIQATLKQL